MPYIFENDHSAALFSQNNFVFATKNLHLAEFAAKLLWPAKRLAVSRSRRAKTGQQVSRQAAIARKR